MAGNTDQFFELVEATFDVDEITPEKIMDKFYRGTIGNVKYGKDRKGKQRYGKSKSTFSGQSLFRGLAETLSEGRGIVEKLQEVTEFDELRELKKQARGLDIHSKEVTKRVDAKIKIFSKELSRLSEERIKKRLEEEKLEKLKEKQEKKLNVIEEKISSSKTLGDINKLDNQLNKLEEIDVSEVEGLLNERLKEIEEEKERKTELIRQQQQASRERKLELEEEGIISL